MPGGWRCSREKENLGVGPFNNNEACWASGAEMIIIIAKKRKMYVIKMIPIKEIKLKIPGIGDGLEICSERLGRFVLGAYMTKRVRSCLPHISRGLAKIAGRAAVWVF